MGMMLSMMLILGFVEKQFVLVPQAPAIKPGFSNIVLMYALCMLGDGPAFLLLCLKVILSGFLFAGISSIIEKSKSPCVVRASVLGMGVAVIVKICGF